MLPKEGKLRLEREEDLLLLPHQQAVALEVDGQIRWHGGLPRRPQPPAAFGMRLEDAEGGRLQDQMPRQLPQAGQPLVDRHLDEAEFARRLRGFLFDRAADPEKARRLRAVQKQPQKEAQRKSRKKPQNRPGEVLPESEILFFGGSQETRESLDGPIQFDPEDGAQAEIAKPSGT